jgi:flagellar biosynthesis regulator FlaF
VNVYETHYETRTWTGGKRAPFCREFDLLAEAKDHAEQVAKAENLPVIHIAWNCRVEDITKPDNCITVEEIRLRNPRAGDGTRVFAL